jgi:alpha-D-ribose 1-methylphosphonate 5-triphosphate synthase subunit PhnH
VTIRIEAAFHKVFDTQYIYRQLLDAIARPGKICSLKSTNIQPPDGLSNWLTGIVFTLLDSETTFATLPANGKWNQYICLNTGAQEAVIADAEYIIVEGSANLPQIAESNCGHLLSPELGSSLLVMVNRVAESGVGLRLTMSGPGIKGRNKLVIEGLSSDNLARIILLNQEYPLGVDVFFIDCSGRMAALPRSSVIQWEVAS